MVQTGKPLGVFIFVIDTILATCNIYIIARISAEKNVNSFIELASLKINYSNLIVNVLLIITLCGIMISNFIIVGDMAV